MSFNDVSVRKKEALLKETKHRCGNLNGTDDVVSSVTGSLSHHQVIQETQTDK